MAEQVRFEQLLGIDRSDPDYIEARRVIAERAERSIEYVCAFGCCIWEYDPVDAVVRTGFGPAGCPCDDREDDSLRLASKRNGQ